MRFAPRRIPLVTALAAALAAPLPSEAVRLDADGVGQALIFPYYSARTASGSPLNTYLSIVNHTADAKAVRVRFREGRMGAETLSFNLFLAPNDVWTGAVVPSGDGTRLLSADVSCTDPAFAAGSGSGALHFMDLSAAAFASDGAGTGLDRTREGYVEMIEMATLAGASATAVTHNAAGVPPDCASVRGAAALTVAAPSGGLSGGLTLINVANGMNFTLDAEALADLSTRPFYRAATDPYPDFNAAEIDPASAVFANGALYRSVWSRPVDAVSAVLMRSAFDGEYVLDRVTASNTDFVVAFPTRHHYVTAAGTTPPFQGPAGWANQCLQSGVALGDRAQFATLNRETQVVLVGQCIPGTCSILSPAGDHFCANVVVFDFSNVSAPPPAATRVLGSITRGLGVGNMPIPVLFEHGWLNASFSAYAPAPSLASLPSSTRLDLTTGALSTGAHVFTGLPLVGFSARTFTNGTLACGAITCQGNYGGAFPLQYRRTISP